jgi:type VI protein secretion system component Hcp
MTDSEREAPVETASAPSEIDDAALTEVVGGDKSKTSLSDIHITKPVDVSSPNLF